MGVPSGPAGDPADTWQPQEMKRGTVTAIKKQLGLE
jgi:hypothetical protein